MLPMVAVLRDHYWVNDVGYLLTNVHHLVSNKGVKMMTAPPGCGRFRCKIVSISCDHWSQYNLDLLVYLFFDAMYWETFSSSIVRPFREHAITQ